MKRICKYCGKEYEGDPGSSACRECAERVKKAVVRTRVCRQCEKTFQGGPRAWYCPDCRQERKREADARHYRTGTQRPLGSMDKCTVCGKEYVVKSWRQKYCPDCAAEASREVDRKQSAEWSRNNTTPERRKEERKAAAAPIPCAICGKLFIPSTVAITCSPECSKRLAQRNQASFEAKNHERRVQYHRERIRRKKAAMSPEEYRAYREKINKQARENYKKRKLCKTEDGGTTND